MCDFALHCRWGFGRPPPAAGVGPQGPGLGFGLHDSLFIEQAGVDEMVDSWVSQVIEVREEKGGRWAD